MAVGFLTCATSKNVRQNLIPRATAYGTRQKLIWHCSMLLLASYVMALPGERRWTRETKLNRLNCRDFPPSVQIVARLVPSAQLVFSSERSHILSCAIFLDITCAWHIRSCARPHSRHTPRETVRALQQVPQHFNGARADGSRHQFLRSTNCSYFGFRDGNEILTIGKWKFSGLGILRSQLIWLENSFI